MSVFTWVCCLSLKLTNYVQNLISSPLIQTIYYTKTVLWARIKPFVKCEIVSRKVMGGWTRDGVWLEIWAAASWVLLTNNTNVSYGSRKVETSMLFYCLPEVEGQLVTQCMLGHIGCIMTLLEGTLHLPPHQTSGKLARTANKWSSAQHLELVHDGVDDCVAGCTHLVLSLFHSFLVVSLSHSYLLLCL